jgi:hypothetical protein
MEAKLKQGPTHLQTIDSVSDFKPSDADVSDFKVEKPAPPPPPPPPKQDASNKLLMVLLTSVTVS